MLDSYFRSEGVVLFFGLFLLINNMVTYSFFWKFTILGSDEIMLRRLVLLLWNLKCATGGLHVVSKDHICLFPAMKFLEREGLATYNTPVTFCGCYTQERCSQVPLQESIVRWVGGDTNGHGESTLVLHLSCVSELVCLSGEKLNMWASLAMVMVKTRKLLVGSWWVHGLDVFLWIWIICDAIVNFQASMFLVEDCLLASGSGRLSVSMTNLPLPSSTYCTVGSRILSMISNYLATARVGM
jgi:hypothetical protein